MEVQLGDKAVVHAFHQRVLGYGKKLDLLVRPSRSIALRSCLIFDSRSCHTSSVWGLSNDHTETTFTAATAVVLLNVGQDEVTLVLEDNNVSLEVVGFAGPALDNYGKDFAK